MRVKFCMKSDCRAAAFLAAGTTKNAIFLYSGNVIVCLFAAFSFFQSAAIGEQAMLGVVRILVCASLLLASMLLLMAATRQFTELYHVTLQDLRYLRSNVLDESIATSLSPMPSQQHHRRVQEGDNDDASFHSMAVQWWHGVEKWVRRSQWWPSSNSDWGTASRRATSQNSLAALTALWSHGHSANARYRDNDACSRLYVDSKNNQVCIIAS